MYIQNIRLLLSTMQILIGLSPIQKILKKLMKLLFMYN